MEKKTILGWIKEFCIWSLKILAVCIPAAIVATYLGTWAGVWAIIFFGVGMAIGYYKGFRNKDLKIADNIVNMLISNEDAIKEGKVITFVSDEEKGEFSIQIREPEELKKKAKKTVTEE